MKNAFRIRGPLWQETTSWLPEEFSPQRNSNAELCFLVVSLSNHWTNNQVFSDLKRYDTSVCQREKCTPKAELLKALI